MTLSEEDLRQLRGVNDQVSMSDVEEVYLPLSRLLNLHFRSARQLAGVKDEFLGRLFGRRFGGAFARARPVLLGFNALMLAGLGLVGVAARRGSARAR